MAMDRRNSETQSDLFISTGQLPISVGHVFNCKFNELLAEFRFVNYRSERSHEKFERQFAHCSNAFEQH
jgi:hypothetical protein